MSRASIPVDLFNPGQVFACLGFMEVAEVILGSTQGGFDWISNGGARFYLEAPDSHNPFAVVLDYVSDVNTSVEWLSPDRAIKERDGGDTIVIEGISASKIPKPAYLPARLRRRLDDSDAIVTFGYWADDSSRFSVILKKSTNGASSHVRFHNGLSAIREHDLSAAVSDPMNLSSRTDSLFRLDPRGSVDPINAGTSPDKLRKGGIDVRVVTYPICEIMAVIGLENSRPWIEEQGRSAAFSYRAWGGRVTSESEEFGMLPIEFARAAIATELPFIESRKFIVRHEEVKSGGDRKITNVTEETRG